MEEIKLLILTILVELPVALVLLQTENWRRVLLVVIAINMISHPIIWEILFSFHINWFVAETMVIIFESIVLLKMFPNKKWCALYTGTTINVVTAAIGYLFF